MNCSDIYESDGGLFAWTPMKGNRYGLNCCIWGAVGGVCNIKVPVVMFTKKCHTDSIYDCLLIRIDTLEILKDDRAFDSEFASIMDWIRLNQSVLINHWDSKEGYSSSIELINQLVKINGYAEKCVEFVN